MGINLKINIIAQLKFEASYCDVTVQRVSHYATGISKMQSGRDDTLKERYAIKFCFKLGKNATETCGMLQTAFGPTILHELSISF